MRLFLSILGLFLLSFNSVEDVLSEELPSYKVGVILPLSGEAASIGIAVQNGIELAIREVDPELRRKLEIVYEDDGFQPKNSVTALEKLKGQGITTLVGAGSATNKAMSSIAENAGITFISISSSQDVSKGKKRVFNFWVTPEELTRTLLPEAKRRGMNRIGVISSVHEGMLSIKSAFDRLNNGQIQVLLDDEFTHDIKDFKRFISRIRSTPGLDGILVNLLPGQSGIFVKQMRELGVELPVFSYEVFADPAEVLAAQGALKGQWYVNAATADPSFSKRYSDAFPGASNWAAANGYDIVLLLVSAIKSGIKPGDLADYLRTLKDFKGALGIYSATNDNRFSLPGEVLVVQ